MRAAEWATRFYGMAVPSEIAVATREQLSDRSIVNLVEAHLAINYAYFGAIDKTLAGFVVLDDEDDNYHLLDLRDGGQVWWQDHETRELELRFDSFADYTKLRESASRVPRGKRTVSTPALCARYQWLVWSLAQPLRKDGAPTQSPLDLVRGGVGRFRAIWPERVAHDTAFEAELRELKGDPHLAIYWLLHTTMFADDRRRERVLDAIGSGGSELLRAFAARLRHLPLGGDLPIVPDFRQRRALSIRFGMFGVDGDHVPREYLRALEASPDTQSLQAALIVHEGIDRKVLDPVDVAAVLERIPEATPGTELLRAVIDRRNGKSTSKHADALARLLAKAHREDWWLALEALWFVHELAYDGAALVAATERLLGSDRYHRRALQMAMRAAQIVGDSVDELEQALEIADGVLEPLQRITQEPANWEAIVHALPPPLVSGLAWRVLQRVELNKPVPALFAWAAAHVLAGTDPARHALVGWAFAKLESRTQAEVVAAAAKLIDRGDHPLVSVLFAFLDGPEPPDNDYAAQYAMKRSKEAAIVALAPFAHTSPLFERLLALVERPASGSVVELIFNRLFDPLDKATYILHALDAPRAIRVARAMIATRLRHPHSHARNAAGHQLYRFDHPGAEAFLIDALVDHAVRYAAIKGPGGALLDQGKTENDQLEDLVAQLYSAVRNLKTPVARSALVERLFAERRSYWRLGRALADTWDFALHAEAMHLLNERRDPRAAGAYAFTLYEFVKQWPPLADLAREIVDWQAETEISRGFLHYALVVSQVAALELRDFELVRRIHEAAAWISEAPLEPDDYVRRTGWQNPLEEPARKQQLERVLSGAIDAARKKLIASADKARAKGKPNLKITDKALGELALSPVTTRILHDRSTGELWFVDGDSALRYFDGYAVVDPPFTSQPITDEGAPLTGDVSLDERALLWDADFAHYREAIRLGHRIVLAWGPPVARQLIKFADAASAAAWMRQLRANPVPGFTASHPYYLPDRGAVLRTYRQHNPLFVLGARFREEDHENETAAIAEHERREAQWIAQGDALLSLVWSSDHVLPKSKQRQAATKKPAAKKPAAKKPAAKKPAAKKPAAGKPAAKKPAAKKPATKTRPKRR